MHHALAVVPFLENLTYVGVFFGTFLAGYLFPVPEEIILLTAGYLGGIRAAHLSLLTIAGIAGILAGDIVLYRLSRSEHPFAQKIKNKIVGSALWKSPLVSRAHMGRTIFFLRFVVGVRSFSPVLAGISGMHWRAFLFWDTLALLVYVPFFVFLGFRFWYSFVRVVTQVEIVRHVIFFGVVALAGALIAWFAKKELTPKREDGGVGA